ncbi:DUF4097 family beta strand repeat-containing protein [Croceivirga thetidis]|uniref:DUF4097 family beta strand repeat protein n=1 Tax=Croceivirga thetidis TaxID=2721623 RepID=A0ABX1GPP1_9FLAO|nr:DUF4097 family beta strand repeat-containing protein [Croceivirga thetidis]NKI30915.1 DUF4097 family beta strand repeat protein [Croceivirga thetidis]
MKRVLITAIACVTVTFLTAQEDFSKSLNGIEWVKIISSANVDIIAHDSNEIIIKSRSSNRAPDRSKGLRLVGAGGTDNTNVGFSVLQEGNDLIVTNLKKNANARIYLPKNQKISVKSTWNGDIEMEGFTGEIEANCQLNGSIKIEGATGPITANSLNGSVEIIFDSIDQDSPTSIFTTNGAVDVSLPGNTKADLSMSSWNGDVYTNFDIEQASKEGMKKVSSKKSTGTINGGGVSLKLRSTNGNIYLRKK